MKKVFNFTPHAVVIMTGAEFRPEIRKYVRTSATTAVCWIPSSGMLNAKMTTEESEPINGIPTFAKVIVGVDPIPDEVGPEDIVVVSALYASAYQRIHGIDSRLYTVADPVYDDDYGMRIVGCRGICAAF